MPKYKVQIRRLTPKQSMYYNNVYHTIVRVDAEYGGGLTFVLSGDSMGKSVNQSYEIVSVNHIPVPSNVRTFHRLSQMDIREGLTLEDFELEIIDT